MSRRLSGSFQKLAPKTLLQILSAAAPTGVLSLETDEGPLRLEVVAGTAAAIADEKLTRLAQVLESARGSFSFEPCELPPIDGATLPLSALAEAAHAWLRRHQKRPTAELDLERLAAGDLFDFSQPATPRPDIHVLPRAAADNPLDDLLAELEETAPGELLFARVGVLSTDPRPWRGKVEEEWRRRGWRMLILGSVAEGAIDQVDILVVHHRLSGTRAGHEEDWIGLIRRAHAMRPPVPVVWVGPLGDQLWVHRLVEAGVAFLMPLPQGESGEPMQRLLASLTLVVDRLLASRQREAEPEVAESAAKLAELMLGEADPDRGMAALLELTAESLSRGAVLRVEDTSIRCQAGFGYPIGRGATGLPRGVGFLERVIRSREAVMAIDPNSAGALQLARVLGVDRVAAATAVIPLGVGETVAGVLVADRAGEPLPDLGDLVQLVSRLGGVVVQG